MELRYRQVLHTVIKGECMSVCFFFYHCILQEKTGIAIRYHSPVTMAKIVQRTKAIQKDWQKAHEASL